MRRTKIYTKEDSFLKYTAYLDKHIRGVDEAWSIIVKQLIEEDRFSFEGRFQSIIESVDHNIANHDKSKYSEAEFDAYMCYFYPYDREDHEKNFNYAWLHHQNINPHHWQYWCLINDDDGKIHPLDMKPEYVIEMVCDWASFEINNPGHKLVNWYKVNKNKIVLTDKSRNLAEDIIKLFDSLR